MSVARIFPFAGDGKWYWQDADCDEAMGPFDSYREAWRDYKAMRRAPLSRSIATGECNELSVSGTPLNDSVSSSNHSSLEK